MVFEVEKQGANGWEPYTTADSTVQGDQAKATVKAVHGGGTDPVQLRFTAHIQIQSTSRAVKFEANVL